MPAILFNKSVQVQDIFSLLYGGDTTIRELKTGIDAADRAVVACFVDAEQTLRHLLVCDFPFANSAGAALSLVPAAVVNQAVKRKQLDENLRDNLREVLNICSNLFLTAEGEAVRLDRMEFSPVNPGGGMACSSQTFEIQIPRYPSGRIELVAINRNE